MSVARFLVHKHHVLLNHNCRSDAEQIRIRIFEFERIIILFASVDDFK